MRNPIDFVAVHQKQRAQLLRHLDSNRSQICARRWITPQLPKLIFTRSAARAIDPHHDPVLIGAAPHQCIWKRIVKRPQDRLGFVHF